MKLIQYFFHYLIYILCWYCALSAAAQVSSPFISKVRIINPVEESNIDSETSWITTPAISNLIQYKQFESKAIGSIVSYHIFLPPAYFNEPNRRFPVIYWLHGSGVGIKGIPFVASYFSRAMDSARMPPSIVVFPNGLPDGMWCDSKDGKFPVEKMFIEDFLPHIDETYRTISSRDGRFIEGFSMGGYGAARLGLKNSDKFRAISMLGAGPLQTNFLEKNPNLQPIELRKQVFAKVYGSDAKYFEANSPWKLAEECAGLLPRDFNLRIVVGESDRLRDKNREFSRHLKTLGIKHQYLELSGVGHDARRTLLESEEEAINFYNSVFPSP